MRLALHCPPQLVELSGYVGASRLIALWWSPCGDELMGSDGTLTATGSWRGWLCFCDHALVRLFLEPYRLGDSDDDGEHRLLVDRYLGTLDVGLARDVEQLLATHASEVDALDRAPLGRARRRCCCNGRLTSTPSGSEQRALGQLRAEVRAFEQREQGLLQLAAGLLAWTRCGRSAELSPAPGMTRAGEGGVTAPADHGGAAVMPSRTARRPHVAAPSPAVVSVTGRALTCPVNGARCKSTACVEVGSMTKNGHVDAEGLA